MARPNLEALEDRIVPTVLPTVITPTYVTYHGGSSQSGSSISASTSGYTPYQIRTAYGINSISFNGTAGTGAGQTIAIVDAYNDPNILGDLDTFDKQFGVTAATSGPTLFQQYGSASSFLTVYNQNGQAINPASTTVPVDRSGGWEAEEALDVEWAHAIAPGAKIDLVEANSASNALYTAVATAAKLSGVSVVSMSWSSSDSSGEQSLDSTFTTPTGHQGVTFLASTGDEGVGGYPAFSPNVIAVGGTTLNLNASGTLLSETAWSTGSDSWDTSLGTGGGTSQFEAEPTYQQSVQQTGFRTIPDVAFDADPNTGVPVYDSYANSSPWGQYGGTSLSSPSWAGLIAIANQGRSLAGLATLNSSSNPQQTLTALYSVSSNDFHDITTGSITANGNTYNAGIGYDEVTGLGTPVANLLVADLAAYGTVQPASKLAFTTQPPSSILSGTTFSTIVQLDNQSGSAVAQAGVSVTLTISSGTLGGTTTVTTNASGQAVFSNLSVIATGSYSLTATSGTLGQATSTSFTVTPSASLLAFTTQPPSSVVSGSTLFNAVVQLESQSGSAVAQAGVSVTLAVSSGTLGGTSTVSTNASGQAVFSNLIVTATAGSGYTLTASSGTLGQGTSTAFAVTQNVTPNDWFSQNIPDPILQALWDGFQQGQRDHLQRHAGAIPGGRV